MTDVLFITPNVTGSFKTESIGTLLLATILKQKDISCKVLPFGKIGNVREFDSFLQNTFDKIEKINPKIVSMYTRCDTFHVSLKLAEQIKARFGNICIVLGGPQSDTTSSDVISNLPYIDFVCCGEGETTIYPLFKSILEGSPDLSIDGLVYRENGTVKTNKRPKMIEDLDTLPMIDYNGVFFDDYKEEKEALKSSFFPIDVGRGCPFGCAYCSTQAFWGRNYRLKSPKRILDEIREAHRDFGSTKFIFNHDMFTLNKKSVIETCKLINELDFKIIWSCSARLDCLDQELIDTMVDAGMIRLFVGIETGSKRMQKLVHKNLNLDTVMDKLLYIREKNILIDTSFIYGFPEETKEDLSQTMALMAKIMHNNCGIINTHLCTFLPKTELSQIYQKDLVFTDNYTNFTGDVAIKQCEDIIKRYPILFPQLMEYKTELRSELRYFAIFIRVWMNLTPIYRYISEQYGEDKLIDMYYDFVEANRNALDKYLNLTLSNAVSNVIKEDVFYLLFKDSFDNDKLFDIVTDMRTMRIAESSEEVKKGGEITNFYCFNPRDMKSSLPIQEYQRGFYAARHTQKGTQVQKISL